MSFVPTDLVGCTNSDVSSQPPSPSPPPQSVSQLPNAAIDLANRMFDLARNGDLTLLDYLHAGLPPNLTNNRGDTLLMLACYHGHFELVEKILQISSTSNVDKQNVSTSKSKGSPDPNQLNGRGQSIVAGAVFKGYDSIVHLLIQYNADPIAGHPSAQDTAKMLNKWNGENGFQQLFETAPGRGFGAKEASVAVEDREEVRRIPGVGIQSTSDR